MNILHIISDMDPRAGGVCQAVRTMIRGLSVSDFAHEVVCLNPKDSAAVRDCSYPVHALGRGTTSWNYSRQLTSWLADNLCGYDAAILHGLWQYQSYALLKNLRSAPNTRIFIMPHGMLDPYFQRASGRKLKAIRNWLIWHLLERKIVNDSDGLLFTCETEKLLARTTFAGYRPKSEHVVGLGVDPPPPDCAPLSAPGYWLYISRIHPKKGIDLLVDAYIKLKKKQSKSVPSLVIAGPGLDTAYGKKVTELAAGEPDIRFTGMLTGDQKWGAFYGCETFILPSHQENFGIAVAEALACSKPVLISDQVNIWREIDQEGGGLVAPDTAEGITSLLTNWLDMPEDRKLMMAKAAKKAYDKYFTVEVAAERLKKALSNDA